MKRFFISLLCSVIMLGIVNNAVPEETTTSVSKMAKSSQVEAVKKEDEVAEEQEQPIEEYKIVLSMALKEISDSGTGGITIEKEKESASKEDYKVVLLEVEEIEEFSESEEPLEREEQLIEETEDFLEEPKEQEESEEPEEENEEKQEPEFEPDFSSPFSDEERFALAKTLYGEANSVESTAERAMVVWTILNRYDSPYYSDDIIDIVSAPEQFTGYSYYHPVTERNLSLVDDVIERYVREKNGEENVGRVLPADILFFHADEWYEHNEFYKYSDGLTGFKIYFDHDCPPENPY